MRLVITEGGELVADLGEWGEHPVPRAGDYILHPKGSQPQGGMADGCCKVKLVQWGIMARPYSSHVKHFVPADEPFIEVVLG